MYFIPAGKMILKHSREGRKKMEPALNFTTCYVVYTSGGLVLLGSVKFADIET